MPYHSAAMRVLVTGAYGFIGSHIVAGLLAAGHAVIGSGRDLAYGRRRIPEIDWIAGDFNRAVTPGAWQPHLAGVDAVINCAGILQARRGQSIDAIHRAAPIALFEACQAAGVRRVIQISALGAEPAAGTAYAQTKHAADRHLASLDLDWVVLQPSLVYAATSYGGTSLLRGLAALPFVVPLPGGGGQLFQPIAMADLVETVVRLLAPGAVSRVILTPVGPEPMALRDIVLGLRRWLGFAPAPVLALPLPLVRLTARAADLLGWAGRGGSITSTALRQMEYGNTADGAAFAQAIGFTPRRFAATLARRPSAVQDRWHARLYFVKPVLRLTLALYWMLTGAAVAIAPEPARDWLGAAGFAPGLVGPMLWATAAVDILLGALLLVRWRVALVGSAQILVSVGYLLVISATLPALWLDPLGPLLKVVPIIVATLAMMAIEADR